MPGSKSVSDVVDAWTTVALEESGGFAGLRRATTLARDTLDARAATTVAGHLRTLCANAALARRGTGRAMPDAQSLTVTIESPRGRHVLTLDTSELPEAIDALLRMAPGMKPLPPA